MQILFEVGFFFVGFGFFCFPSKKIYERNSFLVSKLENIKNLNTLKSFRLFDLFRKIRTTFALNSISIWYLPRNILIITNKYEMSMN